MGGGTGSLRTADVFPVVPPKGPEIRLLLAGKGTGKFAPEAGKVRMRTPFITRVASGTLRIYDCDDDSEDYA